MTSPTRLLAPLAWLYGAAVRVRNRRLSRPGAASHPGVPVISVGNLTVGGTGKTPMVAWFCRRLLDLGRLPAVVSRGYRGSAGPGPVVVSRGDGPLVSPALSGDEPHMLARSLSGVVVVVGSDRVAGALEAKRTGADVLVLDDGFQHRRLARDLDVVLIDSRNPFGNGNLLPAGTLREPVSSLARADVAVATRCAPDAALPEIERAVETHGRGLPLVRSGYRVAGFTDPDGKPVDAPPRAVAFCGIGDPGLFESDLRAAGVEPIVFRAYGDHHAYGDDDLDRLAGVAREGGVGLVTTEKDLARLGAAVDRLSEVPVHVLRIEAEVYEQETLLRAMRQAVGAME